MSRRMILALLRCFCSSTRNGVPGRRLPSYQSSMRPCRLRGAKCVTSKSGSPSHLGIAVLIVPSGSFFHAQTNVSVDITEELSPNVRMIHFPLDIYSYQAEADQAEVNQGHQPWKLDALLTTKSALGLFKRDPNNPVTLVSGGGLHDA